MLQWPTPPLRPRVVPPHLRAVHGFFKVAPLPPRCYKSPGRPLKLPEPKPLGVWPTGSPQTSPFFFEKTASSHGPLRPGPETSQCSHHRVQTARSVSLLGKGFCSLDMSDTRDQALSSEGPCACATTAVARMQFQSTKQHAARVGLAHADHKHAALAHCPRPLKIREIIPYHL